MRALVAGQSLVIDLPSGQPNKRICYQAINQVAWSELGAGKYRLRLNKDSSQCEVTRLQVAS